MSLFVVTMRTSSTRATRRYKKESGAMRAMVKFLTENQRDNTRIVIYTSPGNSIKTYTSSDEIDFIDNKKVNFYKTKRWQTLRFEVLSLFGAKCMCCFSSAEDGV